MRDLSERDLLSLDCLQAEAVSLDIASKRTSSKGFCILEDDYLTILMTDQKKEEGGGTREKKKAKNVSIHVFAYTCRRGD